MSYTDEHGFKYDNVVVSVFDGSHGKTVLLDFYRNGLCMRTRVMGREKEVANGKVIQDRAELLAALIPGAKLKEES